MAEVENVQELIDQRLQEVQNLQDRAIAVMPGVKTFAELLSIPDYIIRDYPLQARHVMAEQKYYIHKKGVWEPAPKMEPIEGRNEGSTF